MIKLNCILLVLLALFASGSASKALLKGSNPSANCVWLYEHVNYGGWKVEYCEDKSWVGNSRNDKFSSIKVGSDVRAVLFQHINFGGAKKYISSNTANFVNIGWNDKISSVIVVKRGCVNLYQHCDFAGSRTEYCGDKSWVGNSKNDIYSSYVTGDEDFDLYQHINFGGDKLRAPKNTADNCLVNEGFNDVVSSIKKLSGETEIGDYCVRLYEHINYGGKYIDYCSDNSWVGNSNNDLYSSIKLGSKVNALVFQHWQFGGSSKYFSSNHSNFVSIGWNDKISSLIIVRKDCVNFYQHCDFGGYKVQYCGNKSWVGNSKNDQYSSYVSGNNAWKAYQHINYGGRVLNISAKSSDKCLVDNNFNDIISSAKRM